MAPEDEEMSEEESAEEETFSKNGSKPLLIIIIAVVILLGGGAAYFFLFRGADQADIKETATDEDKPKSDEESKGGESEKAEADKGTKLKEGIIFPLEHFIVNVNDDTKVTRYLKIEIKLELQNAEMEPEVENRVYKIRDSIVTILTNKNVDDISNTNGKLRLKEEIKARINSFLILGKIEEVYFTDFIIQ